MKHFSKLKKKVQARSDLNTDFIQKAYVFARDAHKGQTRKSGEEYIIHPVAVADIIFDLEGDEESIITALLHDTVEDTNVTLDDIKEHFGEKIAYLVDALTKVAKIKYPGLKEERTIDAFFRVVFSASKDLRVLCIKLVDRLHNMQTIEFHSPTKQKKLAKETLEIYVPPAYYIGFWKIMRDLEEISFKTLYPVDHEKISEYYEECDKSIGKLVKKKAEMLEAYLNEKGIKASTKIFWRRKYNFYIRTNKLKKDLSEFSSPIGVELVTQSASDCYRALEVIHSLGNPRFDKMKDFIACPKENGYSAFHTSIFCSEGSCIDIHILSDEMKKRNEFGFFKTQIETKSFSNVLNEIISMQEHSKNKMNLFKKVKQDILQDRIHVFSTTGDVVSLPKGATVIDFAFHLKKDKATHLTKVKINNKVAPIHSFLSNGDSVELILSDSPQVTFNWCNWCKSSYAQKYIKDFLHSLSADIAYEIGKQQLSKYVQRFCGLTLEEADPKFQPCEKLYSCKNKKDLYVKIGRGEIEISQFLKTVFSEKDLLFSTFALGSSYSASKGQRNIKMQIKSQDRVGLLNEIIKALSKRDINIIENSSYVDAIKRFISEFAISVKNFDQLFELCEEIENIKGVEIILKL